MSRVADPDRLRAAALRLAVHPAYIMISHDAHFLSPLVPAEWQRLAAAPAATDPGVLAVVEELLPSRLPDLPAGIYFPVPLARGVDAGEPVERLLDRFRYEMIRVDDDQHWTWRGEPVAARTQAFFLEHLGWELAISRFTFEYRVHDRWWDKSYLDAAVTPLTAQALEEGDGVATALLASGQRATLRLDSFRLDHRERLLCATHELGEVLFSDSLRFRMLREISDDLATIAVAGRRVALRFPADS